jgi:serine/threonine protein kinase
MHPQRIAIRWHIRIARTELLLSRSHGWWPQELCPGGSLDKALYVERWRPSPTQALRCALDIAEGMEYLHTAFEASDCGVERAIVHRDLKSPNLLLHNAPPPSGEEGRVFLKIGDLGLSRDKHLDSLAETSKMTGCGSILWMAPEILMQKVYNEKVDVYSFAMCLVEMLDCQLPWTGCGSAAGVPYKVSKGGRPEQQLQGKERTHGEWVALVRECWEQVRALHRIHAIALAPHDGACVHMCPRSMSV